MSLRILIDMNLSPSWVEVLQKAGFEACHWYQLGALVIVDEMRERIRILPPGNRNS
jgi:predicted nuclease of predicted toxin-antitoxin system